MTNSIELESLPTRPQSIASSSRRSIKELPTNESSSATLDTALPTLDLSPTLSRTPSWSATLRRTSETNVSALHPADRGYHAWMFLLSAFVIETVLWGLGSSFGVFLDYYRTNGIRGRPVDSSMMALVSAAASGLMYLLGPPVALILNPRPAWRPYTVYAGYFVSTVALLTSAWCTTALQLLFTQGILFSIGGSFIYFSSFSYLSEWFVERRGQAVGICFAGTAVGGLLYPFVFDALLRNYGSQRTLQALAVSHAIFVGAALPFLKPRLPVSRASGPPARRQDGTKRSSMWKNGRLWIFLGSNFLQALGYFSPSLYLPSYATAIGLSSTSGSILLACVNSTGLLSRIAIGILSDRMNAHLLGTVMATASALAVFFLWGLASTSLGPLIAFSLFLGLASGGWSSIWASVIRDLSKDDPALGQTAFGMSSFARGLGSLVTSPISGLLLQKPFREASSRTAFGAAGGSYGPVVVFAGASFVVAACCEGVSMLTQRRLDR